MTNTSRTTPAQRRLLRWFAAPIIALGLSLGSTLFAQETGTINGKVADSTTGKYLEGAEVSVSGTSLATTTQRDGSFVIRNVPVGAQTVAVNYPGLDTSENPVTVASGQAATVTVQLKSSEIITLGEFKVEGTKEGMSQAVALQKVAIQAKLVTAGDQFGMISEGNVGEYLKYLPGVGVDYNVNDARGVSLRGLKTNFTIVAVDGTPMASASSGAANRRFELEQVTSTNVETTEVYKMLLPDAPADATGGYINMVTKSAFDRQDVQRLSYDVSLLVPSSRFGDALSSQDGTWGKGNHYVTRPNLDLNFARRVSDKFGFNLSYRMSERYDDSPRTEYTWITTSAGHRGTAPVNPVTLQDPTLATYNQNNEQKMTHRESFGAKLDYFITDATKLTFSGQWNWYDLTFSQRAHTYAFGTTNVVNLPGITDNASSTQTGSNPARSISNNVVQRRKYGTTNHFNTTLRHELTDRSSVWVTSYWSQADSKYRDHTSGFLAGARARYTGDPLFTVSGVLENPQLPSVVVDGVDRSRLFDLSNYTLMTAANTRARPNTAQDTKSGVRGDYKYEFDTAIPVTVQVGGAYDKVGRSITEQTFNYTGSAISGAALDAFKTDYIFDYGYGYGAGEVLDLYKLYGALAEETMYNKNPNTWNVTRFDEDNIGGYVRADATFFKTLTLAGGARWEKHELEASRKAVLSTASRAIPVKMDYDKLYPSVMAKYQPTRNWVARAGVSKTVGHPDYSEVLPTFTVAEGASNGNFTVPAPGLKPYYVTNYDISVEYYFAKSGLVSASIFRKDVDGFISTSPITDRAEGLALLQSIDSTITDADLGSSPTIRRVINGQGSTVQGIELMYNQTLSFLPRPFSGLNVQMNWSKMDVDADNLVTQYAQETSANLQTLNFAVGYRQGNFNTQVSANWTDDKLIGTGQSNGTLNSYQAPDWKVNLTARYEISRRYSVYVNVSNLFSKREEYYRGSALGTQDVILPFRDFEFGYPHISLGLRGTF